MKYITAHSLSEKEFLKEPFKIHDSIDSILIDFQNTQKFYIFGIDDNISLAKKTLYGLGLSNNKAFKNYYMDSQQKLIRLVKKIPITELLKNDKATSTYFYKYIEANANELQQENSSIALNKIIHFLINNKKDKIEPHLLVSLCVKLPKISQESINLIEDYIIKNNCSTEMLIEFANNVESCNINKIVKAIANNDTTPHRLVLLKALKKITHKNLTLDYIEDIIIEKDKNGQLIYELAYNQNDLCNLDKLSKALYKIDKNGYMSYLFALNVKNIDKEFFQNAIVEKDKIGTYCIGLASESGYNNELLLDRVIELDNNNGSMVIEFVKKSKMCNLEKALDYLIKHDKTGKYIVEFSHITYGYSSERIVKHLNEIDTTGKLSFVFALTVPTADITLLKEKINKINKPELFCNLFCSNLTAKNKETYLQQIKKIDDSGDIIKLISENTFKKLNDADLKILNYSSDDEEKIS